MNTLTEALGSLYIERGGTVEERDQIVKTIIARQRSIEDRCIDYSSFAVFAEATTTNNTCLFPFKRGAFQGMRTVIPCYVEFKCGMVYPFYDTMDFSPLCILLLSQLQISSSTLNIMPDFTPNSVMLDKHADKGREPWEIFAWCVRDAICKQSGLPK